jgi:hypothetical protein
MRSSHVLLSASHIPVIPGPGGGSGARFGGGGWQQPAVGGAWRTWLQTMSCSPSSSCRCPAAAAAASDPPPMIVFVHAVVGQVHLCAGEVQSIDEVRRPMLVTAQVMLV